MISTYMTPERYTSYRITIIMQYIVISLLGDICVDCSIESNLSSERGVHIQLSGMDERVFWLTQRDTERHMGEEEEEWRSC